MDEEYRRICRMPVLDYFDLLSNLRRIAIRERDALKKNSKFTED